jgi:hypothetical protein
MFRVYAFTLGVPAPVAFNEREVTETAPPETGVVAPVWIVPVGFSRSIATGHEFHH